MAITNDFFSALNDPKAAMWSAGVAFNRSNPLPLDKWSVFQTMAEAIAYAESNAVAYPGQIIAVYDNGKMLACVLTEVEGKLVPEAIGVVPEGDGVTIEVVDGELRLVGFADAEAGAQLVKSADGELSWVVPSTETVEGLQTTVATLQQDIEKIKNELNPVDEEGKPTGGGLIEDVDDLKESVGDEAVYDADGNLVSEATGIYKDIEDIEDKIGSAAEYDAEGSLAAAATGLYAELDKKADITYVDDLVDDLTNELNDKANASDVYTKSEVDSAIAGADHLRRQIVDVVEDIDPAADGADRIIYMVPTGLQADDDKYDEYMVIDGAVEKVGSWEVDLSDYAKIDDVNEALALKASKADLEKKASKEELTEALKTKVDVTEGYRLMSNAEGDKLTGIEPGAEVNVIDSVSSEFKVTEDRQLELVSVGQDKVTGLTEKLNNIDEEFAEVDQALADLENNKVDKKTSTVVNEDGSTSEVPWTLLSPEDQEKLASLVIGDNGVEISGKVNAENVEGLASWVNKNRDIVSGLYPAADATKLQGIEAGAEVNFIKDVTEEFSVNQSGVLSLAEIQMAKVSGLDEALGVIQSDVASLDQLVNGYTTDEGQIVQGVVGKLNDLSSTVTALSNNMVNYVTVADFNAVVGNLEEMKANSINVMEDIDEIKDILQWKDIESV